MFGGGELARIEAGSHESAERELPFGPGMASVVRAMPQQHVQKGVGPRDGITAGVHEAGGGVEFDQDVHKKWLKLAESSSSAPASAREASQQRIPSWPSLPALQAMRRTTDSAKRNSSPQRKGWKRDASEVVPVFGRPTPMRWNRRVGREDGTPSSPHQLPRLTPSRRDRSEATLGLSIGHLPGATAGPADVAVVTLLAVGGGLSHGARSGQGLLAR